MILYLMLIAATAVERVVELLVSRRNAAWAFARGAREYGRGHWPVMVGLHSALLLACLVEVLLANRPFIPWLGWPALVIAVGCQAARWWCIRSLGRRWNARVIVVPGLPLVARGPYRWLRHPNYLVVAVEGVALPMVHTAWVTAAVFSLLNAVLLLGFRIPTEERALRSALAAHR